MLVLMGGRNAKMGNDSKSKEEVIEKHGVGNINNNGERLRDFYSTNDFVGISTLFLHI